MVQIDALVRAYENGSLSRRGLITALTALAAGARTAEAQTEKAGVIRARMLHHVNLQVSDVPRSEAFYRKLFGLPASRVVQGPDNHGLDLAASGLIILQKSASPGRIDHFCVGAEGFDADRLRAAARQAGFDGIQGAANDNFFVRDPDGIRVQVSAVDWSA